MKIALVVLTRGSVSGGYAKYLAELVPRLRAQSGVGDVRVYAPPALAAAYAGFRTWPSRNAVATARWLRSEIAAWGADVVFIPSSVHLDCGAIPVVTMVRNMEPLERPFGGNGWKDSLRNVVRTAAARRACKRSSRVIAVSNHVRDFLVDRWHVDPAAIGTVYHGVDAAPGERPQTMAVAGPFIFTAGSIRPARGLEDLIDAVAAGRIPAGYTVVVAGAVDAGAERYARGLRRTLERAGAADRVVWLGRVSQAGMAWCFSNAAAFVMTSRAEACPNTVLEAMAYGCLSVSTDQPPMPEFYADAALYYRRGDAHDLGRAVREALDLSASEADSLRLQALARARDFTWSDTAAGTMRELVRAVAEARRSR